MMGFIKEFWQFLKERKKLWLFPLFLIIILIAGLMVFAQGTAVAPFIYTIF